MKYDWRMLDFETESDEKEAFEKFLVDKRETTNIPVDADIEEYYLSARAANSLTRAGLTTVGAVCWLIECLGEEWGHGVRNLGKQTQQEVENLLFGEMKLVKDTQDRNQRIDYLIKLLESRRQLTNRNFRKEIADFLRELQEEK